MKEVKLQEICRIEKGKQIDTSQLSTDSPYKYINGGIKESGYYHEYNTDSEAVLVSEGGASCGYVNYVNEKFWCGCHCYKLTESKTLAKYLYYALKGNQDKIMELRSGAAMPNIKKEVFKNMSLLVDFDKNNQQAIVETLDCIQKAINNKADELLSLDELVKSRFIEMFGEPLSESYTTPLSQACIFNPKKSEKKDWTDETIISFIPMPLVSEHGEINTGTLKTYKKVKTGFTYFRENDVLFAKITPCMENGKGAIAQNLKNGIGFGSTEFHVLRPIEGVSNPYWIYYLTAIDSFRIMAEKKMTGSAGQKRVPISFFENMKVNLPPIELQNEFAEFVKLIDKSKFVCHSKNFLCDIFTFSSSTIAYPSVVSIFVCPKRC